MHKSIGKIEENEFKALFDEFYDGLCAYGYKILKDKPVVEDIVHNVFCNLWEKREDTGIHTTIKSYLFRSVHNACLNHLEHLKVKRSYIEEKTVEYMKDGLMYNPEREIELLNRELAEMLHEAVESLPEKCREIFKKSRFQGLRNKEIAEQLGVSVNTVDKQIYIALRKLREQLKDYLVLFSGIL